MAGTGFKLTGTEQMRKKLERISRRLPTELEVALRQEAEVVATACKKATPVQYGALKGSIHVEGPRTVGTVASADIVAGGVAAPYAVYVHENMRARHKVGGPKFIERPINDAVPGLAARIAARIDLNKMR